MDKGHHFEMEVPEVDKAYRRAAYEGIFYFNHVQNITLPF
jgi:hypothetical protein